MNGDPHGDRLLGKSPSWHDVLDAEYGRATADGKPDDSKPDDSKPDDDKRVVAGPNDPLPNAESFVSDRYGHPERPLLVCHGGAFHHWDGACWPEVEQARLRADLYDHFRDTRYLDADDRAKPFQPNRRTVGDLLDALKAAAHLPVAVSAPAWLDGTAEPAAEFIACANGVLHVPTRTVRPLTPNLYVNHAVPFDYDPAAAPPRLWLEFLDQLWGDDKQPKRALQEILGYLISGDTAQQKAFLLVGPKRSGKGTVARVLGGLIGGHNLVGVTSNQLAGNFGLAQLVGKPVAVMSDARIRSDQSLLTERILAISGEDVLTADRKYREPWTGRFPTRFLVLTNELPRLVDSSGALASRFVTLMFTRSFYGLEDTELTGKLLAELPGILNWALDGLERLRQRGRFVEPDASADAVREMADLGSPVAAFVRDRCQVGPAETVACDTLYRAWRGWCEDFGRDHPGTAQTFGRDLRAAVPGVKLTQPRVEGDRERRYLGIGLPDPQPTYSAVRVPSRATPPSGGSNATFSPLARDGTRSGPHVPPTQPFEVAHRPPAAPCEVCDLPSVVTVDGRRVHAGCARTRT